jgi:hypothetical protein
VPNNLSIRLTDRSSTDGLEAVLRAVCATPAEECLPEVSAKALEGLKFNACLPADLAARVLQMRMTDFPGVRKILAEPTRFVTV